MSTKALKSMADEYFYSINSLARRIGEDVNSTKEAYEGLWNTLSVKEQNQAIDETIIQPEVALKYASKKVESLKDVSDYCPKLRIQTGMKYVIDETGSTLRWKDEHSAPFSFMTQSQMNLNLFEDSNQTKNQTYSNYIIESPRFSSPIQIQRVNEVSLDDGYDSSNQMGFYHSDSCSESVFSKGENGNLSENSDSIFKKLIQKTSLLKIQYNCKNNDDLESLVPRQSPVKKDGNDKGQLSINLSVALQKSGDANDETALLDTPGSYGSFQCPRLSQEIEIPKTGFEFLDNW